MNGSTFFECVYGTVGPRCEENNFFMKKLISFLILILFAGTLTAQTTTLTFTGRDANNQHIQLNRVVVANATRSWQETLYYPDTTLTMGPVGIEDYEFGNGLVLQQNNPNPFEGITYATLQTVEPGDVVMILTDVNGRTVETQNFVSSQPGVHQFRINVANAGTCMLTARQNGKTASIKMINKGVGGMNKIECLNTVASSVETLRAASMQSSKSNTKGSTNHPFVMGDEMIYTGYVTVNGTEYQSQMIHQNQFVSENFVFNFNISAPAGLATVTTDVPTNVSGHSATCGGNVIADGGYSVIARGVCWSTNPNPVFNGSHISCGDGLGSFSCELTGLEEGTTYYVRAYAVNSVGTAYGNQVSFTTNAAPQPCPGAATVTDYDGNTYNTVQIGQQCWMKENMKTTHYSDGTSIPLGNTTSYNVAYRYYPNDSSSNVSAYGYLYNLKAVMRNSSPSSSNPSGVQGICPMGWHVPSDAEWTQLTDYVSNQSQYVCGSSSTYIAKALASTTGWISSTYNCAVGNAPANNNATGFSAVPAGGCFRGDFNDFGSRAYFWSAAQRGGNNAWCRNLRSDSSSVNSSRINKVDGFSVRCLRD